MLWFPRYRKYVEFAALCLLASVLLWWFGRNLDWVQVRRELGNSDPYLLCAAILIICLAYVFRAFRWGALLKPLSAARFADLFAATTIGFSGVFLVGLARHAQRARERLEHGLALVVRVVAAQVVDVQRHLGVVDEALEELVHQVHVELTDQRAAERDVCIRPR